MPEEIIEDIAAEKPIEKKPVSVLLSAIVAIAIGSGGGFYASQEMADTEMQTKIAGAKHEIVSEIETRERVITIDTIGTLDTIPAGVAPIMARFTPSIITGEQDTFILSVTRKNGLTDTMMYYGVYCPPAGRTPLIKAQFLDIQ